MAGVARRASDRVRTPVAGADLSVVNVVALVAATRFARAAVLACCAGLSCMVTADCVRGFTEGEAVAMLSATRTQDHARVKTLLSSNGHLANVRDSGGMTPLHWAAYYGNVSIAHVLIENGARVNAMTANNELTPLHVAAVKGSTSVAKLLICGGATVNARDKLHGWTPLHIVLVKQHPDTAQLLRTHGGTE